MMTTMMTLYGDVCFTKQVIDRDKLLEAKNVSMINLEGPLLLSAVSNGETHEKKAYTQRPKAGPHLFTPKELFDKLFDTSHGVVLSLANNHIMDFGEEGLMATLAASKAKNMLVVGAGSNEEEARKHVLVHANGLTIGIIACCERQFGSAGISHAGVAVLGPWIYPLVKEIKKKADLCVVSCHLGSELCPVPSPYQQDLYRSFIDAGADVIYGHHSHVPQGYEQYKNGIIFYGLGNFLVDPIAWKDQPNALWSIVVDLFFERGTMKTKIKTKIATVVCEDSEGKIILRKSDHEESEKHKQYLQKATMPLQNREFLEGIWQEVSILLYHKHFENYLRSVFDRTGTSPLSSPIKKALKILKHSLQDYLQNSLRDHSFRNTLLTQAEYLLAYHLFSCESHKEAIESALGVLGGELKDLRNEQTKKYVREMMPWLLDK